jgi:hypothetical protein
MARASDDPAAIPGYRNYLVYCDESGQTGKAYYGFGSLWMPYERRGDLTALVSQLCRRHRYSNEIKWHNVSGQNVEFYCELVEAFFRKSWLMFHCLVGRRGYIDKRYHRGGYDEALRKHFAMLIRSKIAFFAQRDRTKAYQVVVDQLPSRYCRADEAAHAIVNNQLRQQLGFAPIHNIVTRDSREAIGIQLADVLVGAVVSSWNVAQVGDAKARVRRSVSECLSWKDLRADTFRNEWKFNIWHFYDPTSRKPRESCTRPVRLVHHLPPFRPIRVRYTAVVSD